MTMESAAVDADVARDTGEPAVENRQSLVPDVGDAIGAGRDVLAVHPAEAERLAAFSTALMTRLQSLQQPRVARSARVLIVMPTREIAGRVETALRELLEPAGFRTLLVQGGADYTAQAAALADGLDVLVATTGRLLDHLAKGTATLEQVGLMIVDGADRMRDIRFLRDVHKIVEGLPAERQNVLLSAVASDDVREFATTILRDPLAFEVRGPEGEGEGGAMPRQPRHGQGRPPRQQSRRRDDGNRDQGNRDQGNRDQGNRDQGYREQGNRDDAPRDNQGEQERRSRDRDRQPISHESSLFPSSGPVFGYGDNRSGRRPRGGSGRRGGNY